MYQRRSQRNDFGGIPNIKVSDDHKHARRYRDDANNYHHNTSTAASSIRSRTHYVAWLPKFSCRLRARLSLATPHIYEYVYETSISYPLIPALSGSYNFPILDDACGCDVPLSRASRHISLFDARLGATRMFA